MVTPGVASDPAVYKLEQVLHGRTLTSIWEKITKKSVLAWCLWRWQTQWCRGHAPGPGSGSGPGPGPGREACIVHNAGSPSSARGHHNSGR